MRLSEEEIKRLKESALEDIRDIESNIEIYKNATKKDKNYFLGILRMIDTIESQQQEIEQLQAACAVMRKTIGCGIKIVECNNSGWISDLMHWAYNDAEAALSLDAGNEVESCNACDKPYNPLITGGIVNGHPFCQECIISMAESAVDDRIESEKIPNICNMRVPGFINQERQCVKNKTDCPKTCPKYESEV